MKDLINILRNDNWEIVHTQFLNSVEGIVFPIENLSLSNTAKEYLLSKYPKGIYKHQHLAVQRYLEKKHICLTTGTASGKSLPFFIAGIDLLTKYPESRIIAIYPMRALAKEQESRWSAALRDANISAVVGRIDGQIPMYARTDIIRKSRVLILTPDVIHAWLLTQLSSKPVIEFLKQLRLIIVDEVHSYTGVFGSNSAYLFRRVRHILSLLKTNPQFICASATIADSRAHLNNIFGLDFEAIDSTCDTSPRQNVQIDMMRPPRLKDLYSEIKSLLMAVSKDPSNRFIVFVDSRKQTELLAAIVNRDSTEDEESVADATDTKEDWDHLRDLNILPYRAGYEEADRMTIQDRLTKGSLAGVISTSALELGMDIPHLNVGVLIGVPYSATSFHQRIGRIGRHSPGNVIIISRGNVFDETLFSTPTELMKRPLAEGALYLENQRIQYIHALCIARHGGEHDQILEVLGENEDQDFNSSIIWPPEFLMLCKKERLGEIPSELRPMKSEAGEDPNHAYPLRDVDVQFKVAHREKGELQSLGELSFPQLMREAYPGAIYYYTTKPYRVSRINTRTREITTRHERHYSTSATQLPTMIYPNLTPENIFQAKSFGKISCIECELQVREVIIGFTEKRGPNKIVYQYPLDLEGVYFDQSKFTRNYFTTGVIITHPILEENKLETDLVSKILFEAFLMIVPFERRDVSHAVDKHRMERAAFSIKKDAKFIAIYDQTYGSLRLTGRFFKENMLKATIEKAIEICSLGQMPDTTETTLEILVTLLNETDQSVKDFIIQTEEERSSNSNIVDVILPGSKGIAIENGNKEYCVSGVFFDPMTLKLRYRGRYTDEFYRNESKHVILPIDGVVPIPGESELGYYSMDTGELVRKSTQEA